MNNFYLPESHKGTQPIRVLQHKIVSQLEDTHDDFLNEVCDLIRTCGLRPGIAYKVAETPILYRNVDEIIT